MWSCFIVGSKSRLNLVLARTDNQLHFDRENIYKCEQGVLDEFAKLQKRVQVSRAE